MKPHIFKIRGHWAVRYEPWAPIGDWGTTSWVKYVAGGFDEAMAVARKNHHHKEAHRGH